jgi:recombination protein RecA
MSSFMEKYKKNLAKQDGLNLELLPPTYFLNTGNYALNKLMTGDFEGGIPQGRLACFSGHSSSGKSLVAASTIAQIIKDGGYGFVIDSETSLDSAFMTNCGVDVDSPNYQYIGVDGIPQATAQVNNILKMYRETGETTRGLIVVDSLDMLLTDTEQKRLDSKGDIGGDQGQQAKQLKATLKTWVHSLNNLPVSIICTKQPYVEQDPIKALENPWKITESLKFAFSQIIMFEKLQFKKEENGKKSHRGFTLKSVSYKNRIGREKQVVKIEIPFDHGVEPFSGLIEIATEFGIISKNGGWYTPVAFEGPKFQQGKAEGDIDFMNVLLEQIKSVNNKDMEVNAALDDYVSESEKGEPTRKARAARNVPPGDE